MQIDRQHLTKLEGTQQQKQKKLELNRPIQIEQAFKRHTEVLDIRHYEYRNQALWANDPPRP